MPLLDNIYNQYASRGVSVVGIDVGEPPDVVKNYVRSIGISYPIWADSLSPDLEKHRVTTLYEQLGGVGFPTTFFIDHTGVIRDVHVGELTRIRHRF